MEAIENGKPCDLRFGEVVSISPLKVRITSDFILPESLLIVPQHLTDYSVVVNIGLDRTKGDVLDEGISESDTEGVDERTLTVYNGLEIGDNVVLIRNQGGTKYLILDRV
jgi:hypothetical protein